MMEFDDVNYSVENFDPPPDEELVCSICRCVFKDPMECLCQHVFCKECINNWLSMRKTCPICRKKNLAGDMKPVSHIVKNMISKMKMICPNFSSGCKDKFLLDTHSAHMKQCQYQKVNCANPDCHIKCFRKDLRCHETELCEHRFIICPKDCHLKVAFSSIREHNCIKALKSVIEENSQTEISLRRKISDLNAELAAIKLKLQDIENERNTLNNSNDSDTFQSGTDAVHFALTAFQASLSRLYNNLNSRTAVQNDPFLFLESTDEHSLNSLGSDPSDPADSLFDTSSVVANADQDFEGSIYVTSSSDSVAEVSNHSSDDNYAPEGRPRRLFLHSSLDGSSNSANNFSLENDSDSESNSRDSALSRILKRRASRTRILPPDRSEFGTSSSDSIDIPRTRARYSSTDSNSAENTRNNDESAMINTSVNYSELSWDEPSDLSPIPRSERPRYRNIPVSRIPVPVTIDSDIEELNEDDYPIAVPVRTWDLLQRYANESSGESWRP